MKVNWLNTWVGSSAVVLVGSELIAIAAAVGWAIGGLTHLPPALAVGLDVVLAGVALAATVAFTRTVHAVEPFYETGDARAAVRLGESHDG